MAGKGASCKRTVSIPRVSAGGQLNRVEAPSSSSYSSSYSYSNAGVDGQEPAFEYEYEYEEEYEEERWR